MLIFIKIFIRIKYLVEVFLLREKLSPNEKIQSNLNKKYLIILPHADDELIGCNQLLKSSANCLIINMDMKGGDTFEMHNRRYNELKAYSESCKKELITLHQNKTQQLKNIIESFNPNVICIPSCFDWHPEHFQVMRYLSKACTLLENKSNKFVIAMYQVSVPLHPNYINFAIPMSKKAYSNKWNDFTRYYTTQSHLPAYRFGANERINGKLLKSYAAECYIFITVHEWKSIFEKACTLEMSDILKNNINNLSMIREVSLPFYKLCFSPN